MTLPPKTMTVKCPQCEQIYIDWLISAVGSVGMNGLVPVEQQPSTVCSQCGHRSVLRDLQEIDGVLQQAKS
ncbi:MAG: hypothetical protein AAFY33_14495 [Cyanobacteria bacterium J06643_4]